MIPVPGYKVTTPYLRRGRSWSCDKVGGRGVHTGVDYAAPKGTPVVAARPGTVRRVNYGSAFGLQVAITGPDGTEDHYSHLSSRIKHGTKVKAGQFIGRVGSTGNSTGPHLHFERHKKPGSWSCSNHTDPAKSINWEEPVTYRYNYSGKPSGSQKCTRQYSRLDRSLYVPPGGLLLQKVYVNISAPVLRPGAVMGAVRLRCTRVKNTDHTGYIDIPVHPDMMPKDGSTLMTHVVLHNNPGAVYWSFKAIGGLESAKISTRYVSRAVILK